MKRLSSALAAKPNEVLTLSVPRMGWSRLYHGFLCAWMNLCVTESGKVIKIGVKNGQAWMKKSPKESQKVPIKFYREKNRVITFQNFSRFFQIFPDFSRTKVNLYCFFLQINRKNKIQWTFEFPFVQASLHSFKNHPIFPDQSLLLIITCK